MKISGKAKKDITTSKGGGFLSHIKTTFTAAVYSIDGIQQKPL